PSFASIGVAGRVPPAVEDVVRSALALEPDERPQTARELFERYEAALKGSFKDAGPRAPAPVDAGPRQARPTQQEIALPPEPAAAAAGDNAAAMLAVLSDATVDMLEAFMPEQIATYKLQGFVEEVGGTIIKTAPGLIKVRL